MDPNKDNGALQARQVRMRGLVQGVGFREACMRHARAQGVAGWVRNRLDGSVEALLQGTPTQLDAMCAWLRDGVRGARVTAMDADAVPLPSPPLAGFERRPTG